MAIIMPRREQRDALAKQQVNTMQPMSASQAAERRANYTAAPKTNATNVMRNILAKNQGDVTGATRAKVTNEADTAGEQVRESLKSQGNNIRSGIASQSQQLGTWQGQVDAELMASDYNDPNIPTLQRYTSMPLMTSPTLQAQGIDPNAVKKASIVPPSRMYSRGMGNLDRLAFERGGGDRFITEEINRQGANIEDTRAQEQAAVDQTVEAYNRNLLDQQNAIRDYVNNAIQRVQQERAAEALAKEQAKNPMPRLGEGMDEPAPTTPMTYRSPNPAPDFPYPINSPTIPNQPPPSPMSIPSKVTHAAKDLAKDVGIALISPGYAMTKRALKGWR